MDDVCPGTGERESNHLNGRLSELEASQCLPRSKRLQQRLHRGIALRFKASHERDQTSAHLSQNSACLAQAGGDGQADMIGHGARLGRRVFSVKLGLRERGAECVFQLAIRFVERRPEHQGTRIVVEVCTRQTPPAEDETNRCALVQVEVAADVAESDAKEGGPRQPSLRRSLPTMTSRR